MVMTAMIQEQPSSKGWVLTERAARYCTYIDFPQIQPLNFKGTCSDVWNSPRQDGWFHECYILNAHENIEKKKTRPNIAQTTGEIKSLRLRLLESEEVKESDEVEEFATKLIDQKICSLANHKDESKRMFNDTLRNNQNQQQPFKRHNVARAYTVGPGEKKVS
ncbi:hypothetical protein Tco_0972332 [Tanacetum coccineum]